MQKQTNHTKKSQREENWRVNDTMYLVTASVFLYTLFYTPCQTGAFEWTESLPEGTELEVCEGSTASFDWGFYLAPGEQLDTISYHRQLQYGTPDNASECGLEDGMGTPIVSTDPHFTFTPNHQMIINRVTVNDTGNYAIKVKIVSAGGEVAQPHVTRASLLVKVSPVVDERGLQATQQPQAILVPDGPKAGRRIKLSCGTFISLGQPAVTVTWTTPSGTVLPSTWYENGVFSLIVPNPGDYSCQVDPRAPALACVSDTSPLRLQQRVRVDPMEPRVRWASRWWFRDDYERHDFKGETNNVNIYNGILVRLLDEIVDLNRQFSDLSFAVEEIFKEVYTLTCQAAQTIFPQSGVRTLAIGEKPVQVYCDQDTDGGGWTVIQRREYGLVHFYRGWDEYVRGFGDIGYEVWLGLENIHQLTSRGLYTLRVDLWDQDGKWVYAQYEEFSLEGSYDNYRLHIRGYSGTAGDSMLNTAQNGVADKMAFSTHDRDNDLSDDHCASARHGAWWYNDCAYSNLNGRYFADGRQNDTGLVWYHYQNDYRSFVKVEMKIRLRA